MLINWWGEEVGQGGKRERELLFPSSSDFDWYHFKKEKNEKKNKNICCDKTYVMEDRDLNHFFQVIYLFLVLVIWKSVK